MSTPAFRERWYHVGPHGFFDLVRLARRGRTNVVRIFYVLALFAALAIVYYRQAPSPVLTIERFDPEPAYRETANANARLAERFSYTILIAQNIAILVLMPIYIAASVQEERDKRTFGLLFTTQLTAREIVLGKLVSRMGLVGSVLLSGLPILSLITLWGGVDMPVILCNFWNSALWLFSVGSFSLMTAMQTSTMMRGLALLYWAFMTLSLCCCAPLAFNGLHLFLLTPRSSEWLSAADSYTEMYALTAFATLVHTGVGVWCLGSASHVLELSRGEEVKPPEPLLPVDVYRATRSVSDNPIAWKERLVDSGFVVLVPAAFAVLALYCAIFPIAAHIAGKTVLTDFTATLPPLILGSFGVFLGLVALRIVGCIVHERQQQTLDALLTLPMSPGELLWAKVLGNLLRYWFWLWPMGIAWCTLFCVHDGPRRPAFALLGVMAVHLAFFVGLALYLSVACRTTGAAYICLALATLAIFVGTVVVDAFSLGPPQLCHAINPVACWIALVLAWRRDNPLLSEGQIAVSSGWYLLQAATFVWRAHARFARQTE